MTARKTKAPSKYNDCLTGDDMDSFMNDNISPESDVSADVTTKTMDFEVPPCHPQVDDKTNNVTFKTNRIDQWKDRILSFFGGLKTAY